MANTALFNSSRVPATNTVNEAGGRAYSLTDKEILAQFAVTCTFNNTYYDKATDQLDKLKSILPKVDNNFIAEVAAYSRNRGLMKDMPAFLVAYLACQENFSHQNLEKVFNLVIDNGRMLRNFVQFIRSGTFGRKSFGTRLKRMIANWLNARSDFGLFNDAVGNDPSIADIIKMVHPKAATRERSALYGYIIGREVNRELLPSFIRDFEDFKAGLTTTIPNVNFTRLTALELTDQQWKETLLKQGWHTVRMNLNTAARHNVFSDESAVDTVANILRDRDAQRGSKGMPYQIYAAAMNSRDQVPTKIFNALQDAMDISMENVPEFSGKVVVCVDVSGSMGSSITGNRPGMPPSKITCVEAASLIASAILRKNPDAIILPFDTRVHTVNLNSRDSVITNSGILAKFGGGGTNLGCAMSEILRRNINPDLIIYVSDNESWVEPSRRYGSGTEVVEGFDKIRRANRNAKMICLNLQPYGTTQAPTTQNTLNLGGWSDSVFDVMHNFVYTSNFIEEISKNSREALDFS